jgi:hypothetical protein
MSSSNDGDCLGAIMGIVMFILICLIRCDQVKEEDFTRKTNEIENMVEFNQKQIEKLKVENDSLRLHIEVIREQLRNN